MIPMTLSDWTGRGCVRLDDRNAIDCENVAIAAEVADQIHTWHEDIIPAIYVPDGVTECPANAHGRVLIVVYRYGPVRHLRLGSIVFEDGKAHVSINNQPMDEHVQPGGEEHVRFIDLSDPGFPETILQPFSRHVQIPRTQRCKTENSSIRSPKR